MDSIDAGRTKHTTVPPNSATVGAAAVIALISASCCVLPIGLSLLGAGGSWLTFLEPFVAYRTPIQFAVGLVVLWAWLHVLRRPGRARRLALVLTIVATASLAIAVSAPLWELEITRAMLANWGPNQ